MDILLANEYEIRVLQEMADDWYERNHRAMKRAFSRSPEVRNDDDEVLVAGERVCRYIRGLG